MCVEMRWEESHRPTQFIDNEPFSYVNETLEEDIKLTELESPNDIRFRFLVGSPLKLERQLYWPS